MTFMASKHICVAALFALLSGTVALAQTTDKVNLTAPATSREIASLVSDLNDPSYHKRTFATRRLCAIGTPAREKLEAAAAGNDIETVLRAKAVLAVLDRIFFDGVEVRLAFSKSEITWDEPADLIVTMVNRSKYPARVPFEIDTAARQKLSQDARQVGDLLDLADLTHIRSDAGLEFELTVDDITEDPDVVAAVQNRLNGEPISTLKPGQQAVLTVQAFNRGFARYRLLDKASYTVRMEYVPGWNDEILIAQQIGRIVSNEATITVTQSAPATISRSGLEASLDLELRNRKIIVSLTNRLDQTQQVNMDFGPSTPFAEGRWVWEANGTRKEVTQSARSSISWHDFEPVLLVEVPPGTSIELATIDIAELIQRLTETGVDTSDPRGAVYFGYANACDRQWQLRQGPAFVGNPNAPPLFRALLPRHVLSTRLTSPTISSSELK